jgi:carbonic anhydrase/acetyltransferase-like protein (isoleucine patch superfamily)
MIFEYKGVKPKLGSNVFLAPGAVVLGDVEIGDNSNVWFYTVIRGDVHSIRIGEETNIQDHCMLHVTGGRFPLTVGKRVVVGHRAVLHGCVIEDDALIGIGAVVLDGAVVGNGASVAAGAVVSPGSVIPPGVMVRGVPAKPFRETKAEELASRRATVKSYREYGEEFSRWTRRIQ